MTTRQSAEVLLARDEIVTAPAPRACDDHSFELPGGIYVAMALMFTGFIAVLSLAFRGHMSVSYVVIFAFLVVFFFIPKAFTRVKPEESRTKALDWYEFSRHGIKTATGRTKARDATILVLLLPFLIFCFAIAIATIAAIV
jgi:hypothetical protein